MWNSIRQLHELVQAKPALSAAFMQYSGWQMLKAAGDLSQFHACKVRQQPEVRLRAAADLQTS